MIERSNAANPKYPCEAQSSLKAPMGVPSHMGYKLADGVQVREEKFGLLFYNYRGPRLYFLPTKGLIASDFFDGRQSRRELIESICAQHKWPCESIEDRIRQVLEMLEVKGLIYGQSIR